LGGEGKEEGSVYEPEEEGGERTRVFPNRRGEDGRDGEERGGEDCSLHSETREGESVEEGVVVEAHKGGKGGKHGRFISVGGGGIK